MLIISVNVLTWTWDGVFSSLWLVRLLQSDKQRRMFLGILHIYRKHLRPYSEWTDDSGDVTEMLPSPAEVKLEAGTEKCISPKERLSGPRSTFRKKNKVLQLLIEG